MDALRRRLTAMLDKTAPAEKYDQSGWWVGDKSAERRTLDDLQAGRLAFAAARSNAESGLRALDSGDIEMATLYAWSASDLYTAALETQLQRLRASDRGGLERSAKPRGRPRKN